VRGATRDLSERSAKGNKIKGFKTATDPITALRLSKVQEIGSILYRDSVEGYVFNEKSKKGVLTFSTV